MMTNANEVGASATMQRASAATSIKCHQSTLTHALPPQSTHHTVRVCPHTCLCAPSLPNTRGSEKLPTIWPALRSITSPSKM